MPASFRSLSVLLVIQFFALYNLFLYGQPCAAARLQVDDSFSNNNHSKGKAIAEKPELDATLNSMKHQKRHGRTKNFVGQAYFSSEFHPMDLRWFKEPWKESEWGDKLAEQPTVNAVRKSSKSTLLTVRVHPQRKFQIILGMGTSLEETSVYAMAKNHNDEQIKEILRALVDPTSGIGMNLFRLTIGTSDFSDGRAVSKDTQGFYTYQDDPKTDFTIENDRKLNIIRVAKLALQVAQESGQQIKFFASAWSPPAWMKDSGTLIGGKLKTEMIQPYAEYLRKFVQAYENEGIPIYAITTTNEHHFAPEKYPGCLIDPEQETLLVKALDSEFKKAGLKTKIWILDHNFNLWKQAETTLADLKDLSPASYKAADSVAFHTYAGDASNMSDLHREFPDKQVHVTEGSRWGVQGANLIAQYFRNWSSSYVSWVTMATQTPEEHIQGPYDKAGNLGPTLLMKTDGVGPQWYKIPEYYLYGQFMRFVKPGAHRIASDPGTEDTTTNVAFTNPDGSIVIVVINQTARTQNMRFVVKDQQFEGNVPAATVATYVMKKDL